MVSPFPFHYQKIGEIGIAFDDDNDRWYVEVGSPTVRLLEADWCHTIGTFPTPGDAVNAAMKWAKDRGLKLDIPDIPLEQMEELILMARLYKDMAED